MWNLVPGHLPSNILLHFSESEVSGITFSKAFGLTYISRVKWDTFFETDVFERRVLVFFLFFFVFVFVFMGGGGRWAYHATCTNICKMGTVSLVILMFKT